jgi:biotin carboxyl carrier protein
MIAKFSTLAVLVAMLIAGIRTARTTEAGETRTTIEPLTAVLTAGMSGTVAAVNPAASLKAGDRLIELRAPELDAARSARQLEQLAAGIPPAARTAWIEAHQETAAAEAAYIDALADLDRAPADPVRRQRLAAAARERQLVRQRISESLRRATNTNIAALERRLRDGAELKAPADATVDLMRIRVGDRVKAGQPLALLTLRHHYVAEVVLTRQDRPFPKGVPLTVAGRRIDAAVESVTERRIPFGFRKDRRVATEPILRLRFTSSHPIAPGTPATVSIP